MRRIMLAFAALSIAAMVAAAPAGARESVSSATTNHLAWSGYDWRVKSGRGALGQCWSPSRVSTAGGTLKITSGNGCGGGVGMLLNKTYGTWTVRYRMTAGAGVKYGILLWPASGSRPEVDFAEGSKHDPLRQEVTGTYHPLPACNGCIHVQTRADMTQWHTLAVRWTSASYVLTIDGRQWARFDRHNAKAAHLSIQTWQFAPGPQTVLEVADVAVS